MSSVATNRTVLLIGASRGLGCAIAAEYLDRGSHVVATVRGPERTPLHGLADTAGARLEIEHVDINAPEQVRALRDRLGADQHGTIAIMSSGQGSVANDDRGGFEIYRASKSALTN